MQVQPLAGFALPKSDDFCDTGAMTHPSEIVVVEKQAIQR